jgi:hypothetical protein
MSDLFNIDRVPVRGAAPRAGLGEADPTPPAETGTVGVFITMQSITTFPVASTIVSMLWNLSGVFNQRLANDRTTLLVISLIIGLLIYLLSKDKGKTTSEKVAGVIIALINTAMLAAAALGIDVGVDTAGGAGAGSTNP